INRIDEVSAAGQDELAALVSSKYPGTPVLRVSARTGQGFDGLIELLDQEGDFGRKILDIDYDIYPEGEAELGWFDRSAHLSAAAPFALDPLLMEAVQELQKSLGRLGGEVAHLKVIGLSDTSFGVANLISSNTGPELSLASQAQVREADLIVNARVAID